MLGRGVLVALLSVAACAPCPSQEPASATDIPSPAAPARPQRATVPKGSVRGTVYCADTNQPARLAHISVVPVAKDSTGRSFRGETDLEGRFTVGNLPEGKYYIAADLLGYLNPLAQWIDFARKSKSDEERKALEARLTTVEVTAGQAATAALRLERGAEISGTVLYDDGSPAVGVHVSLKPKTKAPEEIANETVPVVVEYMEYADRTTDDHGRFRILGVAPGEYTVNVELPSLSADHEQNVFVTMVQSSQIGNLGVYFGDTLRASKAKTIKIAGGETRADADITIPLSKLHTIRGRVVVKSTGEAPPSGGVRLLYADTREVARVAMAVDGEFEIPYVADGSYILQAASSLEPLPKIEVDDDDPMTSFVVGGGINSVGFDAGGPTEKTGEMAVLVNGDVSGVVVETPDPVAPKGGTTAAAEEGTASDAGTPQDGQMGPPSDTAPVTPPAPPQL